jgi:uncharacterized protein (DUF2235 family)
LALLLVAIGLLAAAPMFVYAMKVSAASADVGTDAAGAVQKLESLRQAPFATLTAGGSLNADVVGFSDTSNPAVTLRWTIADDTTPPKRKTITIVAIATRRTSMGVQKTVRFTTLRSA